MTWLIALVRPDGGFPFCAAMVIPTVVAPLLQNAILLYCGWQTFKVLETERSNDDTHWLTFWFVHPHARMDTRTRKSEHFRQC